MKRSPEQEAIMKNLLDLNPTVKYLPFNEFGRDFVVGDLHGCIHLLNELFDEVCFDETKDRLISVGDLVDRGPWSMRTLKLLEQPWFHCVLGNHEDLLRASIMKYMIDHQIYEGDAPTPLIEQFVTYNAGVHQWNGGEWISKYFIQKGDSDEKKAFCIDYLKRLNELPLILVVGAERPQDRYNVVHSEICQFGGEPMTDEFIDTRSDELEKHNLLWERGMFMWNSQDVTSNPLNYQTLAMSITYSGHTPVMHITKRAQQINIDTCAFYADFISKDRNGEHGLTIVNPINFDFWTINGATKDITVSNLKNPHYLGDTI